MLWAWPLLHMTNHICFSSITVVSVCFDCWWTKTSSEILTVWSNQLALLFNIFTLGLQVAVGLTDSWACPLLHVLGVCAGEVFLPNCDASFQSSRALCMLALAGGRACLWRTWQLMVAARCWRYEQHVAPCVTHGSSCLTAGLWWWNCWCCSIYMWVHCLWMQDVDILNVWHNVWHSHQCAELQHVCVTDCLDWSYIFSSHAVCWNSRTTLPSCSRASGLKCRQEEPTTCISKKRVSDVLIMTWWCLLLAWLRRCRRCRRSKLCLCFTVDSRQFVCQQAMAYM
jgi:hypothetical protein